MHSDPFNLQEFYPQDLPIPIPVMRLFEVTILGPDDVVVVQQIAAHFLDASHHLTFIDVVGEDRITQYHHIFNTSCWLTVKQIGIMGSEPVGEMEMN